MVVPCPSFTCWMESWIPYFLSLSKSVDVTACCWFSVCSLSPFLALPITPHHFPSDPCGHAGMAVLASWLIAVSAAFAFSAPLSGLMGALGTLLYLSVLGHSSRALLHSRKSSQYFQQGSLLFFFYP